MSILFTHNEQEKTREICNRFQALHSLQLKSSKPELSTLLQGMKTQYDLVNDKPLTPYLWVIALNLLDNMQRFIALMLANWDTFVTDNDDHRIIVKCLGAVGE
jgi:hypothetical protein